MNKTLFNYNEDEHKYEIDSSIFECSKCGSSIYKSENAWFPDEVFSCGCVMKGDSELNESTFYCHDKCKHIKHMLKEVDKYKQLIEESE